MDFEMTNVVLLLKVLEAAKRLAYHDACAAEREGISKCLEHQRLDQAIADYEESP